ncbi:hypothetical protein [Ruegeria sp.]|uniref:hypothetical protein n=1 Tax=Ruegeria sp. TaxID=1879320 RepID=UPI003C79F1E9
MNRNIPLALSASLLLAFATSAGASDDISFPVPTGVPQVKGGFKNTSSGIVTKVKVNQQSQNGCEQIDKEHDGNVGSDGGFYIYYNPECDYEFHVEIKDCNNQELHMSSSDIQAGQTEAHLKGVCPNPNLTREVP